MYELLLLVQWSRQTYLNFLKKVVEYRWFMLPIICVIHKVHYLQHLLPDRLSLTDCPTCLHHHHNFTSYLFVFFIGSYLVQDCPQMIFVTLYGLFPWSQNPLTLLFLTENIKMDSILTKINWKICASFTLYFKFWRYFS